MQMTAGKSMRASPLNGRRIERLIAVLLFALAVLLAAIAGHGSVHAPEKNHVTATPANARPTPHGVAASSIEVASARHLLIGWQALPQRP